MPNMKIATKRNAGSRIGGHPVKPHSFQITPINLECRSVISPELFIRLESGPKPKAKPVIRLARTIFG